MIHAFYLTTRDCLGEPIGPGDWSGEIPKGTPIAMTYFDESGLEFLARINLEHNMVGIREFRLEKPCPIVEAASCEYCSKIVPTHDIETHLFEDENCRRLRGLLIGKRYI